MPDVAVVTIEADPSPMALILAATLRRAARAPKLAASLTSAKGNVALKSSVDPQAVTLRFGDGRAHVTSGVAADADVIIEVDVNRMSDPDAPKPKVTGLARHPKLAYAVSKLLEPPHGTWQEEAAAFWAFAAPHPGTPRGLRVVCTDTGAEVTFGESPAEYELHGTEHALMTLFTGGSVRGIWGSGPDDVWVAPAMGPLQHWTGAAWTSPPELTTGQALFGVAGSGRNGRVTAQDITQLEQNAGNLPGHLRRSGGTDFHIEDRHDDSS